MLAWPSWRRVAYRRPVEIYFPPQSDRPAAGRPATEETPTAVKFKQIIALSSSGENWYFLNICCTCQGRLARTVPSPTQRVERTRRW